MWLSLRGVPIKSGGRSNPEEDDIMKWLDRGNFRFFRGQAGFTLIEVLVAVALFAAITVVFMNALDATSRNTRVIDEHTTARNLATTFIETIRNEPFSANYTTATDSIALPSQYDVEVDLKYSADGGDTWSDNYSLINLQRITIAVKRAGRTVQSLCGYKMDL